MACSAINPSIAEASNSKNCDNTPSCCGEEEEEKSETIDDLHKAVTTLKKHGISVYTGKKATPAPAKNDSPKVETIDFNNVEKSFEELEALYDGGM